MSELALTSEHIAPTPTQSPFLPGTAIQFAWGSISLAALKTCPRLYQYEIIEGWAYPGESVHLRFGLEYHQALQDYANERAKGIPHEDAIHDTIRALHARVFDWNPDRSSRAGKYKNRETLVGLVVDYLDHFGGDDPAATFILDTGEPAVELSFRFELDWGPRYLTADVLEPITLAEYSEGKSGKKVSEMPVQPYLLCGHLDRIVSFNDALYVMDRKTTTTTLSGYYMEQWSPSNQMTLYSLAGQVVLNQPIRGVIIDAAQVLLEKPNAFARGFTYRTPDQLHEWLDDLRHWLAIAETYATNQYWPQNDTACDKFGGCKFREVCSKSPQVREAYLKSTFERIDPIESPVNPFYVR